MDTIKLKCKVCAAEQNVPRIPEIDYPDAVELRLHCDLHTSIGRDEPMYYDAQGRHITRALAS